MRKLNELITKEHIQKHKKAFLFGPVILIFLVSIIYFNMQAKGKENPKTFTNSAVDNSLPEANKKELSESKSDTYDEYSDYVNEVNNDKERNDNNMDAIGFDLPDGKNNHSGTSAKETDSKYQKPDNEVADRMKEMMQKLEEKQNNRKRTASTRSYSNPTNSAPAQSEAEEEPINENYKKYSSRTESSKETTQLSPKSNTGFFSSSSKAKSDVKSTDNIEIFACVHTNQTVMNNQRVKLRSTKEFTYNGKKFPINTIIYGTAKMNPNRLLVEINRINQTELKLEVFDSEDSNRGLYVLTPNLNASMQKELKKEGLDEDDLSRIPFSKSLKNIFEKKIKEEKVLLLNNYKVIIKISPENEN